MSAAAGATQDDDRNTAGYQVESLAYVFTFSVLLTLFLGRGFLAGVPEGTSLAGWTVTLIAFLSTALSLNMLLALAAAPWAIPLRRWWLSIVVVPVLFGLVNVFVYADFIVHRIFRMHINGMLLGMLVAPGARECFTIGLSTWVSAFIAAALIVAAMLGFSLAGLRFFRRLALVRRLRKARYLVVGLAAVFALIFTDKLLYAWGDIKDKPEFMRSKYLFPLYAPMTAKHFAKKRLGMDIVRRESLRVDRDSGSLDYPKASIAFPADAPEPNVLVIIVEGARFDMLDPEVMPFLHGWARENLECTSHFSGGIESRVGLFALMYGMYGSYYWRFLAERRGPVLVSELKRRGYAFRILSCAPLDFCEFKKTLFVEVVEAITDRWKGARRSHDRDRALTDEFISFLDGGERPFFCFMFYGGSHQPYRYPPEHEVFPTSVGPDDVNYVRLATGRDTIGPIFNRFRNSLHCVDAQLRRVIGALEERGLLDETLVFVTGDHGEGFKETGHMGHNSAYNIYQSSTIMVAHVPGESPRKVERFTSHLDVVPTVFGYMGAENPVSDYSQGVSLTALEGPAFVFSASFYDAAIIDSETISIFGLEALNARLRVLDRDYAPVADMRAAISERRDNFRRALEGIGWFTK